MRSMKRDGIHDTRWSREPTIPCACSDADLPEDLRGRGHGVGWARADVGIANSTWTDRQVGSGSAISHGL